MDNGEAERRLRNPVVERKNYYDSGPLWGGLLAAMLFTLFEKLLMNKIDATKSLLACFEACADSSGRARENIEASLPWNLSEEMRDAWSYPKGPP